MARRIRWQIVIALTGILLISALLGRLAVQNASINNPLIGGTYVEAMVGAPQTPLPLLNDPVSDPSGRALISLIYDGLMRIGADGLMEPALAEGYTVDQSGEIYTFRLRAGLLWHDGEPVTADDVVFTLRTLQVISQPGEPALARLWQDAIVDRVDARTVRIALPAPFAPFLSLMRIPILPAHLLAEIPPDRWSSSTYATTLVGTGPFSLVELRDDRAVLQANPTYYDGRPYLDAIEFRYLAAAEAGAAALARGDVTAFAERGGTLLRDVDLPGEERRAVVPLDEYTLISLNTRMAPLSDPEARQALSLGLDRQQLITLLPGGQVRRIDSPILPGSWASDDLLTPPSFDREAARQALNELGYVLDLSGVMQRDGQPLAFDLLVDTDPQRIAFAEAIAAQWFDIGVEARVTPLDSNELLLRLRSGDFTAAMHSWTRIGIDPDPYSLWHSSQVDGGLNYAGIEDAQLDSLIELGRTETDLVARSQIYAEFQLRWIALMPAIPLYQPLYHYVADADLRGIGFDDPSTPAGLILYGVEDRYRSAKRWFTNSYRQIDGGLR
jgi:peptide/nickel transport system substrate-binding protein